MELKDVFGLPMQPITAGGGEVEAADSIATLPAPPLVKVKDIAKTLNTINQDMTQ